MGNLARNVVFWLVSTSACMVMGGCSSDAETSSWTYPGGGGAAGQGTGGSESDAGSDATQEGGPGGTGGIGGTGGTAGMGGEAGEGGTGGTGGVLLPTCECYHGNGRYCGEGVQTQAADRECSVDLLPDHLGDLLRCTDGHWTVEESCPEGCIVFEPGTPDACKVSPDLYYLPWACGVSYTCTQGNNSSFSHTGKAQYAYDFGIPRQTPIHASRAGIVSHADNIVGPGEYCYDGCSNSSCCEACRNKGNRVVVDHGDGTSAVYLHLDAATVSKGAAVSTGDVLGLSGTSGCSYGAHLHFMVMETCGIWYCQSIPMTFEEDPNIDKGSKPVSQNCN